MDTELARTFLAVVASGNFVGAADHLHVTQSTVSARIQTLEERLGTRLFVRNKGGAFMTPAGRRFEPHAVALVRTVERIRRDVGTTGGYRHSLTVGARFGLWDKFLVDWVPRMRELAPEVALRAEVGFEPDLMQGLIDGRLDIGLMYTPQNRPGLRVEHLFTENLILVSTGAAASPLLDETYVDVDWGPEFHAKRRASFPDFDGPSLTFAIGWLGLNHIMTYGGSGYFPYRLVSPLLKEQRLVHIDAAEAFDLPAYMIYNAASDNQAVLKATETIRHMVAAVHDA